MNSVNTPIISIIVPVFNTEEYLVRCLDSIINQSIKNIEIIISNDLSTDHSENIILDYMKKYDVIKYLIMQSKGFSGGARNLALNNAAGRYVGFVDSDDWVDTMMFEKMINMIEKTNADIAVCGVATEYGGMRDSMNRYDYKYENVIEGKMALDALTQLYNQDISISSIVCNKIYRRKYIEENQFTFLTNNYNDDDVFNFLCFLNVGKVAITPHTYYHYYQRNNSLMHCFSNKNIDDFIKAFNTVKNYLNQKNIYKTYQDNYFAYFEKCLTSVLNVLISTESNSAKQSEFFNYLLSNIKSNFLLNDYINYVGVHRIRRFLTTSFKR